jgi:2-succinyl-5-enolpyruvyl-6-hydroxy-3-cyclohexene-1-carboxylate synthase
LWRDLEYSPGTEVLSICQNGLPGLARESFVIRGELNRVLKGLGEAEEVGDVRDDFLKARPIAGKVDELLEAYPDSEPGLVRLLSVYATTGESLFLGNSLPIREWNDFAQRDTSYALVRANRGANGIDGQLSTWLGASADTPDSWGVFGDLTTLYDLAAPSLLGQVAQEGRVLVVINNGGGRIFDRLPRLESLSGEQRKAVVQPQEVDLKSWAGMWGMAYAKVTRREDFDQLDEIELENQTLILEIAPSGSQTEAFWSAYHE